MKNYFFILYFLVATIIFYSCSFPLTQTWYKSDGSLTTEIEYDMGEMMKQMKNTFTNLSDSSKLDGILDQIALDSLVSDDNLNGETNEHIYNVDTANYSTIIEEEMPAEPAIQATQEVEEYQPSFENSDKPIQEEKDFTSELKNTLFGSLDSIGKIDTVLDFYTIMPDSLKSKYGADAILLKNLSLSMKANKEKEEMLMKIKFVAKNDEELSNIFRLFASISKTEGKSNEDIEKMFNQDYFNSASFDPKTKIFTAKEVKINEAEEFKALTQEKDFTMEKFTGMLEMFGFKDISYIYHFDQDIQSVEGVKYELIDANSVKIILPVNEVFIKGVTPGYTIKLK